MENHFIPSGDSTAENTIPLDAGVIESFAQMLERVIPLLGNVKSALEECSTKIPRASVDLEDVNQATEYAAMEILNILENLSKRIEVTKSILNKLKVGSDYQQDLLRQISERLKSAGSSSWVTPEISTLSILLDKYLQLSDEAGSIAAIGKYLDETTDDFLKITVALQVQDITSQQVSTAKDLVSSIQQQLILILKHFDLKKRIGGTTGPGSVQDIEASTSALKAEQDVVDQIIDEWKRKQGKK
ncbi:MAG: hypothetical protein HYR76_08790 [Ignavibacteria bacterium]|nr:hypothetical protein [Ignavibacteria bacterium]